MLYNFVANGFTERNFVAGFLGVNCDFRWKMAVLHFDPPFGELRG